MTGEQKIPTTLDVSTQESATEKISQTSKEKTGETGATAETSTARTAETAKTEDGKSKENAGADAGKYKHPDTGVEISADDLVTYYRDKFANSTTGAQKLLDDIKTITSERDLSKTEITKLTKDIEDLRKIAEGDNPEGLKLHDLQATLAGTTNELALIKENSQLDAFEKKVPLATNKREALRNLARANPKVELQKLWDENLKAGVEAEESRRIEDEKKRKEGAGDQGRGTSMRETAGETIGGMPVEEFNKLPVNKRREILAKESQV